MSALPLVASLEHNSSRFAHTLALFPIGSKVSLPRFAPCFVACVPSRSSPTLAPSRGYSRCSSGFFALVPRATPLLNLARRCLASGTSASLDLIMILKLISVSLVFAPHANWLSVGVLCSARVGFASTSLRSVAVGTTTDLAQFDLIYKKIKPYGNLRLAPCVPSRSSPTLCRLLFWLPKVLFLCAFLFNLNFIS